MLARLVKVIGLLLPLLLTAEIFMRLPRTSELLLRETGGAQIYQSAVLINGQQGQLSTFVFYETADVIGTRLAQKLKLPRPTGNACVMLKSNGQALARYFILNAPDFENCSIVTVLEQNTAAFRNAGRGAPPWPDNIPVLDATATFTAVCEETRSTFLSALSHAATPSAALAQAVETMRSAGWQQSVPSTPDFKIMTQKRKQCVIFTGVNPESQNITINILQREGAKQ